MNCSRLRFLPAGSCRHPNVTITDYGFVFDSCLVVRFRLYSRELVYTASCSDIFRFSLCQLQFLVDRPKIKILY